MTIHPHRPSSALSRTCLLAVLALLLSAPLLQGCREKPAERRTIAVTIEPLRFFTEHIAGNRFDVFSMVPQGGNPESYEPSARQMMSLAHSDLYIMVGRIGFERTWMKRIEDNARHTVIANASEGIVPATSADGISDPHTWMSTANARIMAENICRAITSIDPKDSLYYKANKERLLTRIDSVETEVRRHITASGKQKAFLIYHPILTYFARDYGLRQLPIEQEGREPSAAQMQQVLRKAAEEGVTTFFVQQEFDNRSVKATASELGLQPTPINPLGYDWDKEMTRTARLLK